MISSKSGTYQLSANRFTAIRILVNLSLLMCGLGFSHMAAACIDIVSAAPTVTEGGMVQIDVEYDPSAPGCQGPLMVSETVSVTYETVNNTALAGTDYIAVPSATLVFDEFNQFSSLPITLSTTNDLVPEPIETFDLVITGAVGPLGPLTIGNGSQAITIEDDDVPPAVETVQFDSGSVAASLAEGNSGTLQIEMTSGSASCELDVAISGGSATPGVDFTDIQIQGLVVLPSGVSIPIDALPDNIAESSEDYTIVLSPGVSGLTSFNACAIDTNATSTVTIIDDPPQIAEFTAASVSQTLSEGDQLGFTIAQTSGVGNCEVTISSGMGTATAGADFTPFTPITTLVPVGGLPISAGVTNLDGLVEGTETIIYVMEPGPGISFPACAVGPNDTVTIMLEDTLPLVDVVPGSVNTSVVETASFATIALQLSAGVGPAAVTVVTADGSAIANADYSPLPMGFTVNFPATATVGTTVFFDIPLLTDGLVEPIETFTATISGNPGTLVGVDTSTISITDVPPAIPTVEFDSNSLTVSVQEGGGFTLDIIETGTGTNTCGYRIDTVDGSATGGLPNGDYVSTFIGAVTTAPYPNTNTEPQGGMYSTFSDLLVEGNETFTVVLTPDISNPCIVGTNDTATITIVDVPPPTVQFTTATTTATGVEGSTVNLELELITGTGPASVEVSTSDLTAIAPGDYTAINAQTFSFPATAVSGDTITVPITLAMDNLIEGPEDFGVFLAPGTGTVIGTNGSSFVDITDDPVPTIEFASASTTVSTPENSGSVTLTLEMTAGSGAADITVVTADINAAAGADYTALPSGFTVSFPANAVTGSTETFSIPILTDTQVEVTEQFIATLLSTSTAAVGANDVSTISIEDDSPTVEFSASSISVSDVEGNTVGLELVLTAGTGPASVEVSTSDATAIAPGDYTAINAQTFSFPATAVVGDVVTVPIVLASDTLVEGNEDFLVFLAPGPGTSVGVNDSSSVEITDEPVSVVEFNSASLVTSVSEGASDSLLIDLVSGTGDCGVLIQTVDGTATSVSPTVDFTSSASVISGGFNPAGETFVVDALFDTELEGQESYTVVLLPDANSSIVPPCVIGNVDTATVNITDVEPAVVQFSASSTSVSGVEGSALVVDVELVSGDLAASVVVSTVDGSATAPADYSAIVSQSVTFPAGSAAGSIQQISIPLISDGIGDSPAASPEVFSLQMSLDANDTNGTIIGNNSLATLEIFDPGQPVAQWTAASLSTTGLEGTSVTLDIELVAGDGPATIGVFTTDVSATSPADYAGFNTTVFNFPAGSTVGDTIQVTIPLIDEGVFEGSETFSVVLEPLFANITLNNVATVTITEQAQPTVQFTSASTSVSVAEGSSVNLELELTATNGPASIQLSTVDGTAVAPGDYTSISAQTFTFPATAVIGDTLPVSIPVATDTLTEGSEDFSVVLTPLAGTLVGTNDEATVLITDDPVPTIEFASVSTAVTAPEGGGGVSLTLEMTAGTGPGTVFVTTTDGSATSGTDYTALGGGFTVNFPATAVAGSTETITIPILPDTLVEGTETFTANITGTSSANAGANDESTISITDDTPVPAVVEFAPGSTTFTINENGVSPTLDVVITSGDAPATVNIATVAGTATPPDFTPFSQTLTFAAGETLQSITVPINTDALLEDDESFTVVLTPVGGSTTTIGANTSASVTIVDTTPLPTVQFSTASTNITVDEDAGAATVTIELSGGVSPVSVDITSVNGTAVAGSDFDAIAQTLTIPAGETTVDLSVPISTDQLIEGTEAFTLSLAIPAGSNAQLGPNSTATITIDDATIPGVVEFAATSANVTVDEDAVAAVLELVLTGTPVASSVDIILTAGSAVSPDDFDNTVQTVIFAAGETSNTVSIPVNTDDLLEDLESFTATLVPTPGSGTLVGTNTVSTISITDTTVLPPTVEIAAASTSLTVDENAAAVTLLLERTSGVGTATVQVSTVDGSATSPADYAGISQAVTIAAGETQAEVTIVIVADDALEDTESFTVQLEAVANGSTLVGANDSSTVSIVDTTPPASVDFASDSINVTVAEDAGVVTLNLVLSGTPVAASVDAVITAGSASAGDDFVGDTQTVMFAAGEVTQQISLQINGDDVIEDSETFTVTLTPTPGSGTVVGVNNLATVNITDSTVLPPTVAFSAASSSLTVDEASGGTTVTLELIEGAGPATVTLTTIDGSATGAGGDFDAFSQQITIPSGATTADVVIAINADQEIEDTEIFTVQLTAADGVTEIAEPAIANITIMDSTLPGVVEFTETSLFVTTQENAGVVTLDLQLSGTAVPASVDIVLADAGATAAEDYNGMTQTVVFEAGATTASVTIEIVGDMLVEENEGFTATITPTPGSGTLIGEDDTAQVTIVDTTVLGPTVQFAAESTNVEVDEALGAVTLLLDVTDGTAPGSVLLTPVAATATAGADFAADSLIVDVPVGITSIPVTIPIIVDGELEAAEQFIVNLSANDELSQIGADASATVTIADATNTGTFQFSLSDIQTSETNETLDILVNRTGGSDGAVSVDFQALNGTAVNGEDFLLDAGQLVWEAGDVTPRTISIQLLDDQIPEATENFSLQLLNATPIGDDVQLGTPSTINVEIIDDGDDIGRIRFSNARTDGVGEDEGTVTVEVVRVEGFSGNVMVDYETQPGSATADVDFQSQTGSLIWEAGDESSRQIVINLLDDNEAEAAEEFTIALVRAFPVNTEQQLAEPFIHTVQLTDERASAGALSFAADSAVAEEGESLELTVSRSGGAEGPAIVSYRIAGGSATAGTDFVLQAGQLTWDAGDTSGRTIPVAIIADGIPEGEETLVIELFDAGPVGSDFQLGANSTVTVVIPEQMPDPGVIEFAITEVVVDEDDGLARLSVSRTGGSDLEVIATYVLIDGTAVAGADYVAANGQVAWEQGDLEPKEIVVELVNDNTPEETEQFTVQLENVFPIGNEAQFGDNLVAEITITDSDSAVVLDDTVVAENPFRLEVLGESEQDAEVGDEISNLGFQILDTRQDNAAAGAITVLWSVQPAGAVEFPDGTVTVSDANGQTTNRVIVTGTGFIRVIAQAQFDNTEAQNEKGVLPIATRIDTPAFTVPNGSAFFTLRVGLETAPGLTQNQSQTGRGLDNACLELNGIADNAILEGNVNDSGEMLDAAAQQDLIETCEALEVSENLSQDIDRVSHEELFVFTDTVVDTSDLQVTNVYSRINALRSGRIETLDLSGLSFSFLDETIPGSVVNAAQNALYGLATGGGAAADGGGLGRKLGFFANGAIGIGEIDGQGQQQNADVETSGVTVGADYRFTDQFVLGAGLGFVNSDTEFSATGGGAEVDGLNFTVFGTWFKPEVGYLDVVLDAGTNSYEVERQVNLTTDENVVMAMGETDANYLSFTVGAGRNFRISKWELGPYIRYSATRATVDGYSETASNREAGFGSVLDVRSHDADSSQFSFGGQVSTSISTTRAVFVPQLRFEFETQTEGTKDGIPATFQADPNDTLFILEGTERDTSYINYGIGSSVVVKGGHSGFMFIEGRAADDTVRQNWLKLGYRYEFR